VERRRAIRRVPSADEPLSQVRLRAGGGLSVINVSNAGLLVEGATRLLPGTHVDVHVVTAEGRTLVRSRVIRVYVSELKPNLVRYKGALAFERTIDTAEPGNSNDQNAVPRAPVDSTVQSLYIPVPLIDPLTPEAGLEHL
jgi:hypothetical protein